MHKEIEDSQREIIELFNTKAKTGINKIRELCTKHKISRVEEQIASFFFKNRQNLDLESVGEFLSDREDENKAVLKAFTREMNFEGQSFTESLRIFLKAFKLPGEAQKIDRLMQSFSEIYVAQNPGGGIADKDAAYVLAFQVIMLNTDLHNPSVKNKMTIESLTRSLRGVNDGGDFSPEFLSRIYEEIKTKAFEFNFVKVSPGYEITSAALDNDAAFGNLDGLLRGKKSLQEVFPGLGDKFTATVSQPKSWLNTLFGYEGTITIKDAKSAELATIQVYNPGIFSKWLWGEQPKIIIQPVFQEGNHQAALDAAAKIAASFTPAVTSIKGTYDYEKTDLQNAYSNHKQQKPVKDPVATEAFVSLKSKLLAEDPSRQEEPDNPGSLGKSK